MITGTRSSLRPLPRVIDGGGPRAFGFVPPCPSGHIPMIMTGSGRGGKPGEARDSGW